MKVTLTIPGRLPALNDYIRADRSHWSKGANMKKECEEKVMWAIKASLKGARTEQPVRMVYRWYEKDQRRDMDNISSFGRKVIQDALVKMHTIPNDGWDNIKGFEDQFFVDELTERIEVDIIEVIKEGSQWRDL